MSIFNDQSRIGLLVPHTDTTLEFDMKRYLPNHFSVHTERMWLKDVTVESEKIMIAQEVPRAISFLEEIKPETVVFGCTSAGAIYGRQGDETLKGTIFAKLKCRVVSAFSAVLTYLTEINPNRLAVITPYVDSVTMRMVKGLEESGFNVNYSRGMNLLKDIEIGKLTPENIIRFIEMQSEYLEYTDVLFLSCTNLRALECKEILQDKLKLKVITSNEAIIRQLNHQVGGGM
ncbi:hypothetical protein [Siminovitchia sp. 179-K 8D1 HS]|uniref:maleate cis-trans isomerase family protein n=1 Tax=Siminovitchia sp. 179-K 8D1 HS TaxID=3142385 RepID=UPI0039A0754A